MAPSNKIREELVVPYHHIPAQPRVEATGFVTQSLPMAAMFMKNKALAWSAFFLSVQSYLNEPYNKPDVLADPSNDSNPLGSQPPLIKVLFSIISLATCYMDVVFPTAGPGTSTKKSAVETATSVASAVTETVSKVLSS
ncbi:hypothetical protein PACTADRAFT_1026 [Pachysolen tannophilus NRRL Y-2460]|uniref:Uncharacterized protein n=1 Tax=Pachysolen tannophilus NRRL Y-2460 TaxID=669874 RepID=A0A1E4U3H6_PACTA|nr:hypothetical protein PACTADRAFT_1026 [Pachysolen tannophilus NRRL Y-2460]